MITVSSGLAAQIVSESRTLMHRVAIAWGAPTPMDTNQLVTGVTIDRSVNDLPDQLGMLGDVTSARATITLGGEYLDSSGQLVKAADLSPFIDKPWSTRTLPNFGVGVSVTIDAGIYVAGAVEYVRRFTGYVRSIQPAAGGTVQITAIDRMDRVRGTLRIPAAGVNPLAVGSVDDSVSPLAVAELALRAGGWNLTPPARPTALIAVSNCVSPLPEVGNYDDSGFATTTFPGYRMPAVRTWGVANSGIPFTGTPWLCGEMWARGPWPSLPEELVFRIGTLFIAVTPTGVVRLTDGGVTVYASSGAGAFSNDTSWHYIGAAISAGQVHLRVDSTTFSAAATPGTPNFIGEYVSMAWRSYRAEGMQVWTQSTFNPATDWNNAWTPNYTAQMDLPDSTLRAVPQQDGDAGDVLRDVAQAQGAISGFDEAGVFTWQSRSNWNARRYATPARTITGDYVEDWSVGWTSAGVRRSVSANVVTPQTKRATTPAWKATEVYTCPAKSAKTYQIAIDPPIFDVQPPTPGNYVVGNSRFSAVRSSSVGDPAALYASNVSVSVKLTSAGIDLTIQNSNLYEISLWTPGSVLLGLDEGPLMELIATQIILPDPVKVTVSTGADSRDDLVMPDSSWIQDRAAATAYLSLVASEAALPLLAFEGIPIWGDPRIQLGDVVAVDDSKMLVDGVVVDNPHRMSDSVIPCLVVGVSDDMPYNGPYKTTLTLRACYPPVGWVLDVAGRSELDSTTILAV